MEQPGSGGKDRASGQVSGRSVALDIAPFTWGVASGDPSATSVVLWTRIDLGDEDSVGSPTISWELWETDETPADPVFTGVANAEVDGTVRVHVTGLTAGLRYSYRFGFDGSWSAVGSTASLDPDSEMVRLGIACCARLANGPLLAYEGLRLADPNIVVHLGDYIYEDGGRSDDDGPTPEPPWECRSFDDYSARYAQSRRDESLRALHRSVPWVAMPDDHEVTDGALAPRRRADAVAAYRGWMPQADNGNGPTTFDRHVPLGRVGDLIMIDTRHGGRQAPAGNGPTTVAGPGQQDAAAQRSLLSEAQWSWLDQVIGDVDRPWLILASQVQVSPLRLAWLPQLSWPPRWRPVVNPDQWDGYPADRDRLIELFDRHDVDRVLIISGDLHARFVTSVARNNINRNNGGRIIEVTTPSVTAPTFASLIERRIPLPTHWRTWRLIARWIRRINPHIVDMDLERHGTTLLEIDAETIAVTAVSPNGRATQRWEVTVDGVARVESPPTTLEATRRR